MSDMFEERLTESAGTLKLISNVVVDVVAGGSEMLAAEDCREN